MKDDAFQDAPALRFDSVGFSYREASVFDALDLTVERGGMTALLGPNGTGKTTLIRLAAGSLLPSTGRVDAFGRDLSGLDARERARKIAVVPQETRIFFDFTVREVVLMGRGPHLGFLGIEGARDREIAQAAMDTTRIEGLASRSFRALSGGERQRVLIARALTQEPRLLLLDEPTAFLDLEHQLAVYELLADLRRETGLTLVVATHDVNLAARHSSRLVLLHAGKIFADGAPRDVLRVDTLRAVYGVDVEIRPDAVTGIPYVIPVAVASRLTRSSPKR